MHEISANFKNRIKSQS